MKSWRYDTSAAPTKQEQAVKSKCLLVDEFPDQQVIDEFLIRKGSIPTKIDNWQRPNGAGLVEYLAEHLRWETPATFEKVLPLVTRWQVINFQSIPQELRPNDPEVLIPKEIKKKRTPQTVLCFEIEWTVPGDSLYSYILSEIDQPLEDTKPFLTIERQDHVMQSYPQLVQAFEDLQAAKKKPKKAKKLAKEPDKIEEPPKQKKTRAKKPDSSCKRIDAYFQQRKSVVSKKLKSLESQDIGKSQSSRYQDQREDGVHNTDSKLAGTLPRIFDQLNSEDFASDVDADCAEMSMIIQRTCSQTSTNLPTLMPVPPHRSALDCVPEEKPRVPSPIIRQPEVLDISSDDDFVYIPLGERLKARV
uniref:Gen protein n=1 Tax=Fopius arisanus TaxID=64838 RepID=A0A0C9RT26_9HYME